MEIEIDETAEKETITITVPDAEPGDSYVIPDDQKDDRGRAYLPHTYPMDEPINTYNTKGVIVKTQTEVVFLNSINAGMMGKFRIGEQSEIELERFYPIIGQMTGMRIQDVAKLSWEDLNSCVEIILPFLQRGRKTGVKKS